MIEIAEWPTHIGNKDILNFSTNPNFVNDKIFDENRKNPLEYYRTNPDPTMNLPAYVSYNKSNPNLGKPVIVTLSWDMQWDIPYKPKDNELIFRKIDTGYHPCQLGMIDYTRTGNNDYLHNDDHNIPTIMVKYMFVQWKGLKDCQDINVTYRPGPREIAFRNYREYWRHGKFICNDWDSVQCLWWNGFITEKTDYQWNSIHKSSDTSTKTRKDDVKWILDMQKREEWDLFSNKFFHNETDEFIYLSIVDRNE
jgi:hypothetical protein